MDRRQFIRAGSAASAASVLGLAAGCASTGAGAGGQVVVIGGGYGGATAAKYIRMWSEQSIRVTLIEPVPPRAPWLWHAAQVFWLNAGPSP